MEMHNLGVDILSKFYRQRRSVNNAESAIKRLNGSVNQIEYYKNNIRSKVSEGLEIKNMYTLLDGIKWINNDTRGQVDWLKTNLISIYYEIDEREARENK